MTRLLSITTFGAALGCGLVAGVFFAFSTFVMPALARLPAAQGIAAMQSINITAINRWFMAALLGTALLCLVLIALSLLYWSEPGALLRLLASVLYLAGVIIVTRAFNIPLNDALAVASPESADAANLWSRYLSVWTAWNHVRTVAPLGAAALLTAALFR